MGGERGGRERGGGEREMGREYRKGQGKSINN